MSGYALPESFSGCACEYHGDKMGKVEEYIDRNHEVDGNTCGAFFVGVCHEESLVEQCD